MPKQKGIKIDQSLKDLVTNLFGDVEIPKKGREEGRRRNSLTSDSEDKVAPPSGDKKSEKTTKVESKVWQSPTRR